MGVLSGSAKILFWGFVSTDPWLGRTSGHWSHHFQGQSPLCSSLMDSLTRPSAWMCLEMALWWLERTPLYQIYNQVPRIQNRVFSFVNSKGGDGEPQREGSPWVGATGEGTQGWARAKTAVLPPPPPPTPRTGLLPGEPPKYRVISNSSIHTWFGELGLSDLK